MVYINPYSDEIYKTLHTYTVALTIVLCPTAGVYGNSINSSIKITTVRDPGCHASHATSGIFCTSTNNTKLIENLEYDIKRLGWLVHVLQ